MKTIYRITADFIFGIHLLVLLVAVFGWLYPSMWVLYMIVLVSALISDIFLGYCILSKWEFILRKKVDQKVDYSYSFTTYYTRNFTKGRIDENFYRSASVVFLALSIIINLYFLV